MLAFLVLIIILLSYNRAVSETWLNKTNSDISQICAFKYWHQPHKNKTGGGGGGGC